MRIKYIANVRIPTTRAQGYAIMKMCEQFAATGNAVDLIVPDRANKEITANPFHFYKVRENFRIRRVFSFDFLGKSYRFGKLFYWIDILLFLAIAKISIGAERRDVLYTRDFMTIVFFPMNKNTVLELHDIPNSGFLFNTLIRKPKLLVVLNNNLKQELISRGIPSEKIIISPSGVELQDFDIESDQADARRRLDLPMDKKIVVYSGQFYPWKGADTLAESAKILQDVHFVFVGGTEPEIASFRKKYQDQENILIRPFQERDLVPYYLKSADVLVIPNSAKEKISSHYTSPLKLFEYMASGKPIVASDLPSMREAIGESECLFARPDDPQDFASKIKSILEDEALAKSISEKSYQKAKLHSWEKRTHDILENIIRTI